MPQCQPNRPCNQLQTFDPALVREGKLAIQLWGTCLASDQDGGVSVIPLTGCHSGWLLPGALPSEPRFAASSHVDLHACAPLLRQVLVGKRSPGRAH